MSKGTTILIFIFAVLAICFIIKPLLSFSSFYIGIPLIFVLIIYGLILSEVFKKNKALSMIISLMLSAAATYVLYIYMPNVFA